MNQLNVVGFLVKHFSWVIVIAALLLLYGVCYGSLINTIVAYRVPLACGGAIVFTALYFLFRWYSYSYRGGNRKCTSSKSLNGATVIITGGNSGIGKGAAIQLASRGARVIIACRSAQRAEEAIREIKARSGKEDILFRKLDLASFKSVREFADRILQEEERLDVLINNAGIPDTATHDINKKPLPTEDGFSQSFQINHFGHFLLTNLLLDLLKKSAPSRVVNVTSRFHTFPKTLNFSVGEGNVRYPKLTHYARGKLANVLFTNELSERMRRFGVTSYAVDPGAIFSNIWEKVFVPWKLRLMSPILWILFCDEDAGANTTVYCAVEDELESGKVYFDCRPTKLVNPLIGDAGIKQELWDVSMKATGLQD